MRAWVQAAQCHNDVYIRILFGSVHGVHADRNRRIGIDLLLLHHVATLASLLPDSSSWDLTHALKQSRSRRISTASATLALSSETYGSPNSE